MGSNESIELLQANRYKVEYHRNQIILHLAVESNQNRPKHAIVDCGDQNTLCRYAIHSHFQQTPKMV